MKTTFRSYMKKKKKLRSLIIILLSLKIVKMMKIFSLDSDADKKEDDTTSTLNLTGAKSSVSQQLGGFQNPSTSSEAPQFITKEDLEKALAKMKQYYQVPQEAGVSSSKTKKFKTKEKKVELGYEGSNVFITDDQWRDAKRKNSFTSMATSLLVSTFSPKILLFNSNYKGGKSKNTDERLKNIKHSIQKL
ncbi:GSCOCG00004381001-RA-CDS [Cotesia congregata]|nr:GSCOCG00004381001-RA-CDS [Cotesia congregata]